MKWEKVNLMFPEGHTIVGDDIPNEELMPYDCVITSRFAYARDMVIRKEELKWTSDGEYTVTVLYDVNELNNKPEEHSCLSVYGNKMVLDYYQRNQYAKRRYCGEVQRAGFNYTGI